MKKLLVGTFLSLVISASFAATAVKPGLGLKASKATSSKNQIVGVWTSVDRTAVIGPGTMTLSSNGKVTLAPDGFDPLEGTYKVQGQFLDITTDRGRASLIFKLDKNTLSVQYENGAVQNFTKKVPSANPKSHSLHSKS